MKVLESLDVNSWEGPFSPPQQDCAIEALEQGQVLYFPHLAFCLAPEERRFLSPTWSDGRAKNISFDPGRGALRGTDVKGPDGQALRAMMARYATATGRLLGALFPSYRPYLEQARTSFRPLEVEGRPSSYKKDDRLLHTDAFPSRPTRGSRILRLFSNVNPSGQDRIWLVGEPFENFTRGFLPAVPPPLPGSAWVLAALGITKGRRTLYDHIMLQLHDRAKRDARYQNDAPKTKLAFPPGSTWVAFTDQVLHAALSGQFLFEQTFHLPVAAQRWPDRSPLRTLERLRSRRLVG